MADIRNSRKVRQLAAQLRDECATRGVTLVAGEAEQLLAVKMHDVAEQLGVSERTALNRYMSDESVSALAESIAAAGATYHQAVDTAEPVILDIPDAGRVVAALGMTMKLATDALQSPTGHAAAVGVATDCADAVAGVGVAIRTTTDKHVQIGGSTLVYARKVLQQAVELIRDGAWECPCRSQHIPGSTSELQTNLIADLNLLGGWAGGAHEPPAHDR